MCIQMCSVECSKTVGHGHDAGDYEQKCCENITQHVLIKALQLFFINSKHILSPLLFVPGEFDEYIFKRHIDLRHMQYRELCVGHGVEYGFS